MKIENVFPHPSEDDLDIVTLGPGIKCVVHKGQFKTGDVVKLVPMKTVKKGIICHGMIVKEENYVEFNTEATFIISPTETVKLSDEEPLSLAEIFDGGNDSIARAHFEEDALFFDVEEDSKNFAEDE